MPDECPVDPFLAQLCEGYTQAEVAEIERYIAEWDASSYILHLAIGKMLLANQRGVRPHPCQIMM